MKNIIYCLFFLVSSYTTIAQVHQAQNAPYIGTWEYQQGNQVFRLIIWEDDEPNPHDNNYYLHGHYEMVEVNGNQQIILYSSNDSNIPNNQKFPWVFTGTIYDGILGGSFKEFHQGGSGLNGSFTITYIPPACQSCPPKIFFTAEKSRGLIARNPGENRPNDFVIPRNIELVKQ